MHISTDLIEATHLISAMLLEVPQMAHEKGTAYAKSYVKSRHFRKFCDMYDRQVFKVSFT